MEPSACSQRDGIMTPKVRIDYSDVRMSLMEERYFEPIYNWHASRGIIFGCDNNGRGLEPHAYGDYYRATRWYSDTSSSLGISALRTASITWIRWSYSIWGSSRTEAASWSGCCSLSAITASDSLGRS